VTSVLIAAASARSIARLDAHRRVTADLRERAGVRDDDRATARHRLEPRETEALEKRRKHEALGAGVVSGQRLVGNFVGEDDVALEPEVPDGGERGLPKRRLAAAGSPDLHELESRKRASRLSNAKARRSVMRFLRGCSEPTRRGTGRGGGASGRVGEEARRDGPEELMVDAFAHDEDAFLRDPEVCDEVALRRLGDRDYGGGLPDPA
jgi:hypothetical protein